MGRAVRLRRGDRRRAGVEHGADCLDIGRGHWHGRDRRAGSAPSFTWDATVGEGVARWTGEGGVSEVVLPARMFSGGISGLSLETVEGPPGACHFHDEGRGEVRVRVPVGAQVELRFAR